MIQSKSSETVRTMVNGKTVFKVKGVLDKVGLDPFKTTMDAELTKFEGDCVFLDLTELEYLNSESIGYLLTLQTRLIKSGKKLVLVGAQKNVMDVLDVIGLDKIIQHVERLDQYK